MFVDIVLRELIKRHRPHGQPDNLIPIAVDGLQQIIVAIMQVILALQVTVEPSKITLGKRSIDIANQNAIMFPIEIDLRADGRRVVELEEDGVAARLKVQLLDHLLGGSHWLDVTVLVQAEVHAPYFSVIDENPNVLFFCCCGMMAEADQEGRRVILAGIPPHDHDVTGAGNEGRLVERAEEQFRYLFQEAAHVMYYVCKIKSITLKLLRHPRQPTSELVTIRGQASKINCQLDC